MELEEGFDRVDWNRDKVQDLIDYLRNEECLWRIKSSDYRNKTKKQRALESIIGKLAIPQLTVDHLSTKIKILRNQYRRELRFKRNFEKSGAGRDEIYIPKL